MAELLPDELLVNIFQRLDAVDLVQLSKVCRRWYKVSNSKSLWKFVVHKNRTNSINLVKKLVRHKLHAGTQSFTIIQQGKDRSQSALLRVTPDVSRLLTSTAPSLTSLTLTRCHVTHSLTDCAPVSLTELTLIRCQLPVELPRQSPQPPDVGLPNLRRLSISRATSVTRSLLQSLGCRSLLALDLVTCPRLHSRDLLALPKLFPKLRRLTVTGFTAGQDSLLADLVTQLDDLRVLNAAGVTVAHGVSLDLLFAGALRSCTRLVCLVCSHSLAGWVYEKIKEVESVKFVYGDKQFSESVKQTLAEADISTGDVEEFYRTWTPQLRDAN